MLQRGHTRWSISGVGANLIYGTKAFEEKYIRLYSRLMDNCSDDSELTEEDGKLVKPILRSAFFSWAKQEEHGARLVEPPTPARVSCSGTKSQRSFAATGKLEQHGLSPMLEDDQTAMREKRERQTPGKECTTKQRPSSDAGASSTSGNTNAAKKRLKLK